MTPGSNNKPSNTESGRSGKISGHNLSAIFGLIIVVAAVYIIYVVAKSVIFGVLDLDKEIAGPLIAGVLTVVASVGAVLIAQGRSKRREIDESHRPKKVELYSNFLDIIVYHLAETKGMDLESSDSPGGGTESVVVKMMKLKQGLLIWGSPRVLRAYLDFENDLDKLDPLTSVLAVDKVLREMRRDLGNSNRGLRRGDLWSLFLVSKDRGIFNKNGSH